MGRVPGTRCRLCNRAAWSVFWSHVRWSSWSHWPPAGDFWERAAAPLRTLLERNNLTSADVSAVELLGGTSRVPRLKQALSDVLGGRSLDM